MTHDSAVVCIQKSAISRTMDAVMNLCPFLVQFKRFHREVIIELEKKTEMDVKYMNVSAITYNQSTLQLKYRKMS